MIEVFCTGNQDYFDARQLPAHFFTPCQIRACQFPTSLGFARRLPRSLMPATQTKGINSALRDLHNGCQTRSQGRVKSERILMASTMRHVHTPLKCGTQPISINLLEKRNSQVVLNCLLAEYSWCVYPFICSYLKGYYAPTL